MRGLIVTLLPIVLVGGICGSLMSASELGPIKDGHMAEASERQRSIFELQAISLTENAQTIHVVGRVRTGGWSDPRLLVVGEASGTVCLRFVATPPTGLVTQALEALEASLPRSELPEGTRTVTVLSERNRLSIDITE